MSTLAPEEEEVAAPEWDVTAAAVVEAIGHLAAVDPGRFALQGL